MIPTRFPSLARLGAAGLLAFASACSNRLIDPRESPPTIDLSGSASVAVTRFRADPYAFHFTSGYTTEQRLVIRDAAAWSAAWAMLWKSTTPVPALPAIDFSREVVVVAASGTRPTGGYDIVIDSAAASGSQLLVRVRSVSPGPRCGVTLALTQPVDVARIPVSGLPVSFVEYGVVTECP